MKSTGNGTVLPQLEAYDVHIIGGTCWLEGAHVALPAMLPSEAVVHVGQIDVGGVDELHPFCVGVPSALAVDLPRHTGQI